MSLELINEVAEIRAVKPKKKGKKDDSPLNVVIDFGLDIYAYLVLPYFSPSLRHMLFDEQGPRYQLGIPSWQWKTSYKNMEIELHKLNITLQASLVSKFRFSPYCDPVQDDRDYRDKIYLGFSATLEVPKEYSPLGLLCELINSQTEISMRPSQLILPEMQEANKTSEIVTALGTTQARIKVKQAQVVKLGRRSKVKADGSADGV